MKNRQIQYSPISVPVIAIGLAIVCYIFISISTDSISFGLGKVLLLLVTALFSFILLTWTIVFLVPLILDKPALVFTEEALFVASISQKIPWEEIQQAKIKYTRNNHVVSIFVKTEGRVFIRPTSFFKNLLCATNALFYSTPFSFWTLPLKGRAVDIYSAIKNGQTNAKLKQGKGPQ